MSREPSPLAQCQYPKLVRDQMPHIIQREGAKPIYRRIVGDEYRSALVIKLKEELAELLDAIDKDDKRAIQEEIGDMFDVLTALGYSHNIYMSEVETLREQKNAIKGKFNDGIWMESVESNG
jgi:predicted house-cleaning noncanonical NTP pyrophosphatase (MazG superfamily)